jgi:hypothetical protein
MAKDPAFLFYPGDWLGGTMTFSRHHKGAYMDILMVQFNNGHMALHDIQEVLGSDFEKMWENKLKSKFKEDESGLFFNEKLENEILKRRAYTESRRKNLLHKEEHIKYDKVPHMGSHMENENENENTIVTNGGAGGNKKLKNKQNGKHFSNFKSQGEELHAKRHRENLEELERERKENNKGKG